MIVRSPRNVIGFAAITNSAHCGVLGIHLEPIAQAGNDERIPEGWGMERNGRPTTDPKEAIEHGNLYPIGGAKGAMLALAFELMCAALTGSAIGREADSFFSHEGNRPRIGQAFIAIDPAAQAGSEVFLERVEAVVTAMLDDEGVGLPGAKRFASQRKLQAEGIEVADELVARFTRLAHG